MLIQDLGLQDLFPEIPSILPPFFGANSLSDLRLADTDFLTVLERVLEVQSDADTYFFCLATLHKARLKYERILQTQGIPTVDHVGPRGLLQFGSLSATALAGFMFWRKWLYDIDNRAGQETGYVFEPIVAYAIGGVPYGAKRSPITRNGEGKSGRQVDCVRDQDKRAYEIKLRVTIAASGQGRWGEELDFPKDSQASGYTPILIVLDPTPNAKLSQLSQAFKDALGEVYAGPDAWNHLESLAGPTMSQFIKRYVHKPLEELLREAPMQLPDMTLSLRGDTLNIDIGEETLLIRRQLANEVQADEDELPEDVDERLPF